MANTKVSVCSNALIKLGDDPITSLTDNTNRARQCNRLFEQVRQAVLRGANWNDSAKRQKLAQLADAPAWEFAYAYSLPNDYQRMIKTSLDDDKLVYKIEGKTLLTDEAEVYIKYVYDNDDLSTYDSLHVDALTAKMAYELANAITSKNSLMVAMAQEYNTKINEAKTVDGMEEPQDTFTDYTLVDIRY